MADKFFHHVVMFRLQPGITLDRVREAREALSVLVETLPGVLHFTVTDNLSEQNQGYTMALFAVFENQRAYNIYRRHPEYERVYNGLLPDIVEDRLIAEGEED